MKRASVRTVAVYLTYASIAGHLLVGALLPFIVGLGMLDGYHHGIESAFYGAAVPEGARAHQHWWISLFGPTVQAAAVWMAALAYIGDRQKSAFAWAALIAGIVLWAPQDMYISLLAGAWPHVWIDSAALVIMLPPLIALLVIDHRPAPEEAAALDFGAEPRNVLVTGATGFLGQKLVPALLRGGHRVTVLSRQPRKAAWQFEGRVDCVASMDDIPASRRIDVIINLAGAPVLGWRWTAARRAAMRRSRIDLTRGLVAWIARAERKPELLLSASAIGYYGIQAPGDDRLLDEEAPPQQIFMSDLCREWEEAARQAEAHGVKVACMRIGVVLGQQGALPMMLLPVRLGLGGPLGGGAQWLSWIHVDDAIGAIAHLCRINASGAYNLTAPETQTQGQFARIAAGVLRRPCRMPTPGWPLRLLLGEQAGLLLDGQRISSSKLAGSGYAFRYPTLAGALRSM